MRLQVVFADADANLPAISNNHDEQSVLHADLPTELSAVPIPIQIGTANLLTTLPQSLSIAGTSVTARPTVGYTRSDSHSKSSQLTLETLSRLELTRVSTSVDNGAHHLRHRITWNI
jgi:hypothetical protein